MGPSLHTPPEPSTSLRLERRSLHRDAVDVLGRRIASGDYPEGTALPNETDLGQELAVSRTVVREAVKVLAAKGMVVTRPRTGTRVRPRSRWDVIDHDVLAWIVEGGPSKAFYRDLFEVRAIIEPQAAELAASRRTDQEAAALAERLQLLEAAGDDRRAFIRADLPLHSAILEASRNELLIRLASTLGVALRAGRDVTTRIAQGPSSSMPLHAAVVRAIVDGRGVAARRAMQALIDYATRDMEDVLGDEP